MSKHEAARKAMANSAAAKYTRIAKRKAAQNSHKERPPGPIGNGSWCWCQQPNGHDWPDKEKGAPHPR